MTTIAPISELLFARQKDGSKPGSRKDGRFVSLVIEGGAMRGVVSAGMVAALEQLGLRDSFDEVYGSSAGSITGAYFVARQARYGTTIFYDNINNKHFIDLSRLLRRTPVVSLEYLLDEVCVTQKPLMFQKVLQSDIPLYIVAASLRMNTSVILGNFKDRTELLGALRASARIPFFAGPPVEFRGDQLLDASIYESIPFRAAMANNKATDLVVLLTRPANNMRSPPGLIDKYVVVPYLSGLDRNLATHYLSRAVAYREEISTIMQHVSGKRTPLILPIQTPAEAIKVTSLEVSRIKLVSAAMQGFKAVYAALGLQTPELVEIITPFEPANTHFV